MKSIRFTLFVLIFLLQSLVLFGQTPLQLKRQGFIYDEKGKPVHNALMEMTVYFQKQDKLENKIFETVSNDMGLYYFNVFMETEQKNIKAIRIEWRNYPKMFPQKMYKYSPFLNPYWQFTRDFLNRPSALSIIPLTHIQDIKLTSTENPIPNKKIIEWAQRFSPILIFAKNKKFLPANIRKYYNNHTKETYQAKGKAEDWEGRPPFHGQYLKFPDLKKFKILAENKEAHLFVHIRPLPTYFTGMETGRASDFRPEYYWYENNPNKITGYVVSYWFWYDETDGVSYLGNSHQGSLQGFSILLNKEEQPLRLLTIGHGTVLADIKWADVNTVNDHPILYVAQGFGADGSNVTIPQISVKGDSFKSSKSIQVKMNKRFVDWFGFPRDIFPRLDKNKFKAIVPGHADWGIYRVTSESLKEVVIGNQDQKINISDKIAGQWEKIIVWEEPGWINQPADKDPDKNHAVVAEDAFYLGFLGRFGSHPLRVTKFFVPQYMGQSPIHPILENPEANIFLREYPQKDRFFYFFEKEPYGPFWQKSK